MFVLKTACLVSVLTISSLLTANTTPPIISPARAMPGPGSPKSLLLPTIPPSTSPDFMRQPLPSFKRSSKNSKPRVVNAPNVEPLLVALFRMDDINDNVDRVAPWVYQHGTEEMVADLEDSIKCLERADSYLFESMQVIFSKDATLGASKQLLSEATTEMNEAEWTVKILFEISLIEL